MLEICVISCEFIFDFACKILYYFYRGDTLKNRIKSIRLNEKLTQEEFGSKLNMSRDKIFNIESGRKIIKSDDIEKFCSTFNINEEWMISGKGNMYKTSDKSKKILDNLHKLSESELFNNAVSKLSELNEEELEVVSNLIDLLSKKK